MQYTLFKFATRAFHLEVQQLRSYKFVLQRLWRSHTCSLSWRISSDLLGGGLFEDGSMAGAASLGKWIDMEAGQVGRQLAAHA